MTTDRGRTRRASLLPTKDFGGWSDFGHRSWEVCAVMRWVSRGGLLAAVAAWGCQPASSAPVSADPGRASSGTRAASKPVVKMAKCAAASLAEIDRGLGQVPPDLQGTALAAGLMQLCKSSLDPVVSQALDRVAKGAPQPSDVDRLPEAVFQVVDLSAEDGESRDSFETAYLRLLADMRHRLTGQVRVPVMSASSYPRSDDVEVIVARRKRTFEGRPLADGAKLPEAGGRRFVAVVDSRDDNKALVGLLAEARSGGYGELGVLVVENGNYRVMTVEIGTKADPIAVPLSMRSEGFFFTHNPPRETPPSVEGPEAGSITAASPQPPPDVPAARPGAPLEDDSRWDFDALAQGLPPELVDAGRPAVVGLKVEPGITIGAVLSFIDRLPKVTCPDKPKADCSVSRVLWLP